MPRRPKPIPKLKKKAVKVQLYSWRLQTPGPMNCPSSLTALQAFFLLFNSTVIKGIVDETIHYAQQKGVKDFTFSAEDFCVYLAVLLAMCLHPCPRLQDYWKKSDIFGTPFIYNLIPRERFLLIHQWLHFDIL